MTTKPMIRIHNAETGEVTDREMTDLEFSEYQSNQAIWVAEEKEIATKAAEKEALLAKLGITADEAKLLLS